MAITESLFVERTPRRWEGPARRALDLVVAGLAIVILSPLVIVTALAIRIETPGPALFRQKRVGRDRRLFTMYKFRTMSGDGDDSALRELIARELRGEDTLVDGSTKPHDDPRVTRIGRVLRRTSFDELPQLLNVLRGEMSLVGPRPCIPWEAEMFPPEFAERFSVAPGMTGLWQISGRSTRGTLEMLQLDNIYVKARGFWRDVAILLLTVPSMLRGDGAR